jgi:hypothetical protein
VPLEAIRDAGLRLQRGGVGFYPSSGAPFIHMDVGSVRHWPRMPEAQLARILSKGPLTNVASAQKQQKSRPTVVASRNVRDEDEDAEVVARPASRARVTASVAPEIVAAVPMPKSRPTAAQEPAAGGFNLASASSQPARAPARQETPEAASSGFNLASVSSEPARLPPSSNLVPQPTLSANDVINQRGYWQGLDQAAERPVPPADIPETRTAAVEPPITGSVAQGSLAPWPMPDRAARGALAYAPANEPVDARAAKARTAARPAPQREAAPKPTSRPATPSVKVGERFNNPWLRAMIVSPSALEFMSTTLYGAPSPAALRPHFEKPTATVMMTFSDDPHLGMSTEQFKGNAVVFVATVTFRQRTAALR